MGMLITDSTVAISPADTPVCQRWSASPVMKPWRWSESTYRLNLARDRTSPSSPTHAADVRIVPLISARTNAKPGLEAGKSRALTMTLPAASEFDWAHLIQSATRSRYFAIRHGGMSGFWRT